MSSVSYTQLIRRNRNFRFFWGGQIVSQLGDWFSTITIQALLLKYTGSVTSVAILMIANMLPSFLLGPPAGIIVDRFPRRSVMIAADVARAVVALGLLLVRGPNTVWVAYVCVAGLAVFSSFFEPARSSIIPSITKEEELVTANALSAVTWSVLLTSGALVGGVVAALLGTDAAFLLNSLSFVGSALFLAGMRVPPGAETHARGHGFGELLQGFRYVGKHREIIGALTAKMGWGLAGGVQVLIPVYATRVFRLPHDPLGHKTMSLLFAAGGLGTALGPLFARRFTGRDLPRIRWAIAGSFMMGGLYYAAMSAAPNLALAALFLLLARFHGAIIWVFSTVLLQVLSEDRYRGRVFAAEMSLFTGSMMLSSTLTGRGLDLQWGAVPQATLAMAAMSLAVGAVWVLRLAPGGLPAGGHAGLPPEPEAEGSVGST